MPLPIDEELAEKKGIPAAIHRGLLAAVRLTGEMAVLPLAAPFKVSQAAKLGTTFGGSTFAQTGDAGEAAISGALGVAFPVVSAAAGRYAGGVTSKLLRAGKITDLQAKAIEGGIKAAAMQAAIQGLAAPQYLERPQDWKEIFAENAAMGLAFHVGDVFKTFDPKIASEGRKQATENINKFVDDLVSGDKLAKAVIGGRTLKPGETVQVGVPLELKAEQPINPEVPVEPGPIGVIPEGGTEPVSRGRIRVQLSKKEVPSEVKVDEKLLPVEEAKTEEGPLSDRRCRAGSIETWRHRSCRFSQPARCSAPHRFVRADATIHSAR